VTFMTKCKCENAEFIKDYGVVCHECGKITQKARKSWNRDPRTQVVNSKKIYNRAKEKRIDYEEE